VVRSWTAQTTVLLGAGALALGVGCGHQTTGLGWPLDHNFNVISSAYGPREGRSHDGLDIVAPQGAPIRCADEGEVVLASRLRGYGNVVVVRHAGGLLTLYAHNDENLVRAGERVTRGQILGRVGKTGHASAPHLHFEVRQGDVPKDPLPYLKEAR
jgi:murein DD-endopeptidase MepM/ murein hydrolase activator NlpD